jgi:hypothetical protein
MGTQRRLQIYLFVVSFFWLAPAMAHHVLGRPAYSLNEDSNTPPSMAVETQIGDYFVTYMVFPAFPRAGETGRINLYIKRIDADATFDGTVGFSVMDDSWVPLWSANEEEPIGEQQIDDGVYRQGFVFKGDGAYLIRAHFDDGEVPYDIDFPLRIGPSPALGPLGLAVGSIVLILLAGNLLQGRRVTAAKVLSASRERHR